METTEQNRIDYRRLVFLSLDLICIAGMDGYFKYVNSAWETILGYTRDELLSRPFLDFIHPDDHARNDEEVAKLAAGHPTIDFENRYVHRDGSIRHISWTAQSVTDEKEMYCIGRDVTERKLAEIALEEERYKLREYFENLPMLAYNITFDGKIADCNDETVRTLGYDRKEDLIGKPLISKVYAPTSQEKAEQLFEKWKQEKKISNEELQIITKEGEIVDILLNVDTIFDNNGDPAHSFSTQLDITERKKADEALRESEEKYRTLSRNIPAMIYRAKSDWSTEIISNSEIVCGYSADEFYTQKVNWLGIIHPDDKQRVFEEGAKLAEKPMTIVQEYRILAKEGGTRWVSDHKTSFFNEDGSFIGVDGCIYDVTERKRAEEALRQTNEELLEVYNQRKILSKRLIDLLEKNRHEFAMELHDQIGQTLTSLKMDLELIRGQLKPADTELIFRTRAAEGKAIQLLKDIKNISRGLRPVSLDILGLVPSLRDLFEEIQKQSDVEIHFFSNNVPDHFAPEKELAIYRIAQEGITNVMKHAKAERVFINLVVKANVLLLSIEDDGVGFDVDKAMKTTRRKVSLGLLIMKERAEQLDGEFTLESQVGKGTCLLAEIPM